MKKILFILFIVSSASTLLPQTPLYPGDISIISVNADGNKSFSFLLYRDIEAGTTLNFTDNAWIEAENRFRDSEGVLTYTAPSLISAGTVITCPDKDGGNGFVETGSFNPSGSGDNIIVYQGSSDDPFFIYGIGWARGASVWEYSEVSSSYRSDVPPGLSFSDGTVVSLGTADNYVYSGISFQSLVSRKTCFEEFANSEVYNSSNSEELFWNGGDFSIQNDFIQNSFENRFSSVSINTIVQINTSIIVHDLVIENGGIIEILPGGSLSVFGELVNNSGFDGIVVQANGSGSGAIYSSTENVPGTVEVYLSPDQWHFVSPPVTSEQTLADIFGTPDSHLYGVYEFDETTNAWTPNDYQLKTKNLTGYNVLYQNTPKTLTFKGTLNNFRSRRLITVSRGAGGGWNLIGNPFPAPLEWGGKVKKEGLDHETIYVTTGGSGGETSWDTFNGVSGVGVPSNEVGNVAVGQGFWVQAGDAGGQVEVGCYAKTAAASTFKVGAAQSTFLPLQGGPSFRWDDKGAFLRSPIGPSLRWDDRSEQILRLELTNEKGQHDQVAICFSKKATNEYDKYDSKKMGWSQNKNFGISIPVDNNHCTIASYPNPSTLQPFNSSTIRIPIDILPNEGPQSLRMLRGLEQFASIILEDRALGIVHDLSIQPVYEFHAGGRSFLGEGRFWLHVTWGGVQEEITSVDWVEELKSIRVEGFYNLAGQWFETLMGQSAGIYFKSICAENRKQVVKIYYNGNKAF